MTSHSILEAVKGEMIDFEALYENIGSLKRSRPASQKTKGRKGRNSGSRKSLNQVHKQFAQWLSAPSLFQHPQASNLLKSCFLQLKWHPGFAAVQKEKNIRALHEAAARAGHANVLEVSTKSDNPRGQELSAFNLKVRNERLGEVPLECVFQGSKVFERGGPFVDLYSMDVRSARKDPRLKESGKLVAFEFDGTPLAT